MTVIRTEPLRRAGRAGMLLVLAVSCAGPPAEEAGGPADGWSVTAWGESYEVFPEVDPLVAGEVARAHTHVTRLRDFGPLTEAAVEIVLRGPAGEQVFHSDAALRPGVFDIEIRPEAPGEFELAFRVREAGAGEEVRGGRVRVGTRQQPGGVIVAPAPRGGQDAGEPLSFLKEQQWRSDFATAWVRSGSLARSVSGLATVQPPAGGRVTITAPVDGVVHPVAGTEGWPHVGRRVRESAVLFRLVPQVAADRSLPSLAAEAATLAAELAAARSRLGRLEELLDLEASSLREVEEAKTRVQVLEVRLASATRDAEAARAARQGGLAGSLVLRAPLSGEVAAVTASPGATVAAGAPLARLVSTDKVWLEVALSPDAARELADGQVHGVVLSSGEGPPVRLEEGLRLVAVAPELSPRTGTVTIVLEAPSSPGLFLGRSLEAQVLLGEGRRGIVIPSSALVDDGGVPVVFLQLSGETFLRQEVQVLERQGARLAVGNLVAGQRVVTRGGEAIRRASLMAGGQGHGHVH